VTYRDEINLDDGLLPERERTRPHVARLIAAFLITPALAALGFAIIEPGYDGLPRMEAVGRSALLYAFFGAYPSALIFGVPAYLALRKNVRATVLNCALAGAIIAAIPWLLFGLAPGADQAWTDNHPTIINGHYTLYGWIEFAQFLLTIAAGGAAGGAIFWLIAAAKLPKRQT